MKNEKNIYYYLYCQTISQFSTYTETSLLIDNSHYCVVILSAIPQPLSHVSF